MRLCIATRVLGCLLLGFGAFLFGCKDKPPAPSQLTDLGDGGRVLMPSGASWHAVPYSRNDTADWVEFRKPHFNEPQASEEDVAAADATSEGQIKAEILAFIKEYNEVAAEEDFEELLLYHVASQQDVMESMLAGAKAMLAKLKTMEAALNKKLPNKTDAIASTFAMLHGAAPGAIVATGLEVVSKTEVTAQMPPPFTSCRFLLVDDQWAVEVANLPDPDAMKSQMAMTGTMLDTLIQGLESGAVQAETALTQINTMATMAKAMSGGTGSGADGSGADDGED